MAEPRTTEESTEAEVYPGPGAAVSDPAETSRTNKRKRRWRRPLLLLLGPLVALAGGGYFWITSGRYVSTENAHVKADSVVVAAQVAGPLVAVEVAENAHVREGQLLAKVDPSPYRAALARARAQAFQARADIVALKARYQQKREQLALAREDLAYARTEFQRQEGLSDSKVISKERFDAAEHELAAAKRKVAVLRQELARSRAQLAGDPDIEVEAHPRYREAAAALDQAELDVGRTRVTAPFAGVVGNTPNVGDYVQSGNPVMNLVADTGMWVEANFKETALTHIDVGDTATVHVDSYPGHVWHGRVESLAPATGSEFSVLPSQNASGNWVKVVQRIPVRIMIEPEPAAPQLRAGMSIAVEVDTGYQRPAARELARLLPWTGPDAAATRG